MYLSLASVLPAFPFLTAMMPLAIPASRSEQIIPLTKRNRFRYDDGSINATKLQANIDYAVAKIERGFETYEKNTGTVHPLATLRNYKRRYGAVPLTDNDAQLWYGSIVVGTPAKNYTVDFDTGSSDLFLPGPSCSENCQGHTIYDPGLSSTSKDLNKPFSIKYGDNSTVSGTQSIDTVSIAGLTAERQTLGVARTYSTGFSSEEFPADGLLGMAFESLSEYNANPVFQSLIAQGSIVRPVFGVKLTESGSELFLGDTNSNLYSGKFTWVPVTDAAFWQVELDGLSVDGQSVLGPTAAIIDTGTTQIVGDPDHVTSIYSHIDGARAAPQYGEGIFTVPCDFNTPVSLSFDGTSFDVDPKTFIVGRVGGNTCIGGLASLPQLDMSFWIVGDVFLSNVYTAFDVGNTQVGFATLK